MKPHSKFGDNGETELSDGTRVSKDDPRVTAYGYVDELNAIIGWCRLATGGSELAGAFEKVQQDLFVLGAQLAATTTGDSDVALWPEDVSRLEQWIEQADIQVEPLSSFILPGGCELAARLHMARTVCRRVERAVVTLHRTQPATGEAIAYLNRLSDLLFVWARFANKKANCPDVQWKPGRDS